MLAAKKKLETFSEMHLNGIMILVSSQIELEWWTLNAIHCMDSVSTSYGFQTENETVSFIWEKHIE